MLIWFHIAMVLISACKNRQFCEAQMALLFLSIEHFHDANDENQRMPSPGFEPKLSRPERDVQTTQRLRRCCISADTKIPIYDAIDMQSIVVNQLHMRR